MTLENEGKVKGKPVPEELDEMLGKVAERQLRADYRKSLGKEYARFSLDMEVKKIFRKKQD